MRRVSKGWRECPREEIWSVDEQIERVNVRSVMMKRMTKRSPDVTVAPPPRQIPDAQTVQQGANWESRGGESPVGAQGGRTEGTVRGRVK